MPFKLTRFRRRNKVSETSDLAGPIAEGLNDNDGGAQMGALIQSLQGARLDNITGSVLSHNQLTVYQNSQAPNNKDYTEIKVGDIVLKRELKYGDTHHELQSDGTFREIGQIRAYDGYIYKDSSQPMLIRKYEGLALKDWKRDLDVFSAVRHPNILQLYGVCDSRHFTALIFHSAHHSTVRDFQLSLSGLSFVSYVHDLWDQFLSAADALRTESLGPQDVNLALHNVDHAGQLVVHTFSPNPDQMSYKLISYQSGQDIQHLFSRFNPNSLSKSLLEEYYDLLAVICDLHGSWHTINSFNASMKHQEGTTTLYVPEPYILRLGKGNSEEDDILCECMPDMSIRCTIPTSDLNNLNFYQDFLIGVQSTISGPSQASIIPTFNLWSSQVHRFTKQMNINDMQVQTTIPDWIYIECTAVPRTSRQYADAADGLLQCNLLYLWFDCTPSSNTWWSTDSEGQTVIPTAEIEDVFNISLDTRIEMYEYHIPQQIYPILWDVHKKCGFDPESTEMAEYLGYPLLEPVFEPKSDIYSPAREVSTVENSEIDSDNGSENGSTSSDDTFLSAHSNI